MIDGTSPPPSDNRWYWRGLMIVLVLSLTALRFIYLACFCPLDLVPDEAHYWDWSRNLDWSYYSKGPLIAWLIRAAIELFGPLSIALTGNETMAVRIPAVICGSLLLVSLYVLALQVFHSERTAFFTVMFTATLPAISAGSILMTIDIPFLCLWGWALVFAHRAVFRDERWAWTTTGLFVGLGILAKYTMGLWLFSLGLFLLFTPAYRRTLFRSGFWIMVGTAFVCCLPILYWNAKNDWVTFRHVAGQAGVPIGNRNQGVRWFGPLEYLGAQFALLLGYWFIAWLCAMFYYRPNKEKDPGLCYLWWMSAPTFAVFAVSTFKSGGQINWPVAAYLSGSLLMSAWLLRAMDSPSVSYRRWTRRGVKIACAAGVLLTVMLYQTELVRPAFKVVAKQTNKELGDIDFTCRLRGWRHLCMELDRAREVLSEREGVDPVIAASGWATPGELGFYCRGHPQAFSLGPYFGDRHSQYDLWRPNPVADAQVFRGKTFVVVSNHDPKAFEPALKQAFVRVGAPQEVVYREGADRLATWTIWICRDYRGIEMTRRPDNY
jgi:hypothetical protein